MSHGVKQSREKQLERKRFVWRERGRDNRGGFVIGTGSTWGFYNGLLEGKN